MVTRNLRVRVTLRNIRARCDGFATVFARSSQSLICHARDVIAKSRELSWEDLRRGFSPNFVIGFLNLAMFTYFIWGFDYVERSYGTVVINLLPVYFPSVAFYQAVRQEPGARKIDRWFAGFVFFVFLVLLLAISRTYDLRELEINVAVVMLSAPWLVIFAMLVRGTRILAIGMVPAAILLVAYWVLPELSEGLDPYYSWVILPVVSMLLAAWTFLVWILFKGFYKWRYDRMRGPLMESLAMLFLFLPIMVLAIWVPRTIPGGEDWSVVLAAMVGVVFGSVISEPLTRFLRRFRDL